MDVRLTRSPVPKAKVSPKTVVVSKLLVASSAELEQLLLDELAENPALELAEAGYCDRCGATFSGSLCPYCDRLSREPSPTALNRPSLTSSADEWDPFSKVAAPWSLRDHLLWQLYPQLTAAQLEIASVLLGHLDDHGLLDCEPEMVASGLGAGVKQVFKVLAAIQRQDPVGIGARTVRESLLVQLECLDLDGEEPMVELSARLIEEHWEALAKGKLDRIAEALSVGVEEIQRAKDFIRSNLDPYPAHAYLENSTSAEEPVEAHYLRPDVIITHLGPGADREFDIHFPAEKRFRLTVYSAYRELLDTLNREGVDSHSEDYEHVRRCVGRSKLFISGWEERWRTLRKVVEALVVHQREFLLHGLRSLRPLTRAELAETVGLHESTVSRAVASKYAQVPDGQIVALADFFDGSLKAKALIRDLVSQETEPLTDGELVDLLAKAGVSIARRTVAKYRQALGILPSKLR